MFPTISVFTSGGSIRFGTSPHTLVRRAGSGRGGGGGDASDGYSEPHVNLAIVIPVVLVTLLITLIVVGIICIKRWKKNDPGMKP